MRRRKLGRWLTEQLAAGDDLLIKDPRLSWFLPLWTAAARKQGVEPSFVTMLRPPAEVVGQQAHLLQRPAPGRARRRRLGEHDAEHRAGHPRRAADVRPLPRPPRRLGGRVEAISRDLGLDWQLDRRRCGPRSAGFVDPGLRRVDLDWDDLDLPERLESIARRTWEALDRLPGDGPRRRPEVLGELDRLHEEYAAYYLEAEVVSRSTVIAARRARSPPAARAGRRGRRPGRTAVRALAYRSAQRMPAWLRRIVPAGARARSAQPDDRRRTGDMSLLRRGRAIGEVRRVAERGGAGVRRGRTTSPTASPASSASRTPALEVVVVDDGSTDGTGELADRIADERPPGPRGAPGQRRSRCRAQRRHSATRPVSTSPSPTATTWSSRTPTRGWSAPWSAPAPTSPSGRSSGSTATAAS